MATIDEFKSQLIAGGVRSNRFKVYIPRMGENIEFMCKTAAIPGSTLPVVEVPFRGHRLKIAGDRTFEDWTVTIINDINFTARSAVESWMLSIQDLDSGIGATNLDYLVSRATISQLNRDDSVIASYELYNMYPQTLNNIELSYDTADEIQTFDVTFSYSHWERTL